MKILFLSFTCEDIGVAMLTNMTSQLQEILLRRAVGSFEKKIVFHVGISSVSIKINRILHGRLGIRILSLEDKIRKFLPILLLFYRSFRVFLTIAICIYLCFVGEILFWFLAFGFISHMTRISNKTSFLCKKGY